VYMRRIIGAESSPQGALEVRVSELEVKIQSLPSLWEEERKRAKRSQQAAETARRSADEKLEEVQELIEEHGDLPAVNENGSDGQRVQPLRTNMGISPTPGIEERVAAVAHLLS